MKLKFLIMAVFLSSCAMESYLLKQEELQPYKDMAQVSRVDNATKSINLRSITDSRELPGIGMALTGVKYKKTPIVLTTTFNQFMTDFIETELGKRNIVLSESSNLYMDVHINELWVEEIIEKHEPEKAKCKANISFDIEAPEKKWSGKFWTEYTSAGDLTDGTERLAPTFASCLNEIVEKLVNHKEFLELIK